MSAASFDENQNKPIDIYNIISDAAKNTAANEEKIEQKEKKSESDTNETPFSKTLMTEANNLIVPESEDKQENESNEAEKQEKKENISNQNEKSSEEKTNESDNTQQTDETDQVQNKNEEGNKEISQEKTENNEQIEKTNDESTDENASNEQEKSEETEENSEENKEEQNASQFAENSKMYLNQPGIKQFTLSHEEIKENHEKLFREAEENMKKMVNNRIDEENEGNANSETVNHEEGEQHNEDNNENNNHPDNNDNNNNNKENPPEVHQAEESTVQNEQHEEEKNESNAIENDEHHEEDHSYEQNEVQEQHEDIEGMEIDDPYRYGTPNVGKRIDMSTLPLLETPMDVENSCQRQIEYFKKHGKFMEAANIPQVLQYLQREKANYITQGMYMDAHRTDEFIKKIIQFSNSVEQNHAKDAKTGELETRINELDEEIKNTKKETENKIKNLRDQHDKNLSKLQQSQKEEMKILERNWNDPNYLRKYEKPSAKLLQLSSVEHSLVSAGEFEKADEIKNEIDKLEVIESQEAQERAEKEMLSQQKKMMAKHDRENQLLEEQLQKEIEKVTIIADNKTKTIEDRKERVQKQLDSYQNAQTKLPPLKPKDKPDVLITPRTQQRMLICKQAKRNPRISVKPLGQLSLIAKKKKKRSNSQLQQY